MSADDSKLSNLSKTPLEDAKQFIAIDVIKAVKDAFDVEITGEKDTKIIKDKIEISNNKAGQSDLAMPAFALAKFLRGKKPFEIATKIGEKLKESCEASEVYDDVKVEKIYINIKLSAEFLCKIMDAAVNGDLLKPNPKTKEKVMIEYSQPNTHKAFHVGHMRNAALGDCLVRLYDFVGHEVIAANYFGDEGAHIAKCLWKVRKEVSDTKLDIDKIEVEDRAEWLGGMYAAAVTDLDMGNLTKLPFPDVVAAKVLEVSDHPAGDAPKNWHVVKLQTKADETLTVVCGGRGYKVGDYVAYKPLGCRLKNKDIVEKDMKGVTSKGVMLAYTELGQQEPADPKPAAAAAPKPAAAAPVEGKEKSAEAKEGGGGEGGGGGKKKGKKNKKKGGGGGGGGGGKKSKKKKKEKLPNKIYIVGPEFNPTPGAQLTELGKTAKDVESVTSEIKKRNGEVGDMLRAMEEGDKEAVALWEKTKKWSLDEFKRIYNWLSCRFDHDFFESEVSESSRKLVISLFEKGILTKDNGAICANLNKYKLGFLILLKSNGTGLYATKDLALAQVKFEKFKVEKSVYVVDASQTLHFQQVFKVLELMGYEQAKKCTHLPYGMVVLKSGKMSSRKGTVIFFKALKEMLSKHLMEEYLSKYEGKWAPEEIEEAKRQLAVGTIKYGMLNHDVSKDVVFEMDKWSAKTGTTGPYNMYAYTRSVGIKRQVDEGKSKCKPGKVDPSILKAQVERDILIHIGSFWTVVNDCVAKNNPSALCGYVFNLSKYFNGWYENTHVAGSETPDELATRLALSQAIGKTIKASLNLLGITTLEKM